MIVKPAHELCKAKDAAKSASPNVINTCVYIYICVCIYIYIYIYIQVAGPRGKAELSMACFGFLDTLQRGVQWIGGAVDWGSIIVTTPCFHCTPLCRM